jgi:hypothetical protein
MKPIAIALLSLLFIASAALADIVALGVGASSPSEVVVKIDGHDVHLQVVGAKPSGNPAAEAFLRCLVSGRVVKVHKTSGTTAKVTMLDGTAVSDLVNEFLDTTTKIDPCTLGKAAYQPQYAHLTDDTSSQAGPAAGKPAHAAHEVHISYGSSSSQPAPPVLWPREADAPPRAQPAARPKADDVPTLATPQPMSTYQPGQARIATPPTASTTTVGTGSTSTPPPSQPDTPQPVAPYTPPVTQQKPPAQ